MAEIKFKATIKNVYDRFLIVYEKHSKKNENDEWETLGFTDFKVWLPDGMTGAEFSEKDYIEVTGRQKTEKVEKDGKTYKNLVVSAQVVETIRANQPQTSNFAQADAPF
jgi:hypothetical protein